MKIAIKLVDYIEGAGIVEFRVLKTLNLTSENSLRVTLSTLAKAGRIYNPVRGVYVSKHADPFQVATKLYPGYISALAAFYLHHLIDEYPFTILVGSSMRKSVVMGQHELLYFKAKGHSEVDNGPYKVASVERAVYDSLLNWRFVGFPKLTAVLYRSKLDSKKLIGICRGESNAFFQRLGYLISILPSRDAEKERVQKFCAKKVKANTYLQGRGTGKYIKKWKIIDNVGKEVLLSWWRQ
jgi:predicted transcriptional regulator of viral defense system